MRGCVYPAHPTAPYPRANLDDRRLPVDIATAARTPAGVILGITGDAHEVDISYVTASEATGIRGAASGTAFAAYAGAELLDEVPAELGAGRVRLPLGPSSTTIYLPEGMAPNVTEVRGIAGTIEALPPRPRLLGYGDSITEGWGSSGPSASWIARAARALDWEAVNFGYAGAGRGELAVAEIVATTPADVVSIAFGTNCWTTIAFNESLMAATLAAFVATVRAGHARVPLVLVSPVVRPSAEQTPNRVGVTLASLRDAYEEAADRLAAQDPLIEVVRGRDLIAEDQLADGVHPNDAGHHELAVVMESAVRRAAAAAG